MIDIDPTLLQLGPLVISWHGFFSTVGLIAGLWLAVRLGRRTELTEDQVLSFGLWGILGAIVGARLLHVLDYWYYYLEHPGQILLLNEGGIAIYGAILGGVAAGALYGRLARLPIGQAADIAGCGLILGQAIGRIGDIINGEHHGAHAPDLPWSVVYVHPATLGERNVPVHLAVGYELVWDLLVLGILLRLFRRLPIDGALFWIYLWLYSVGRFVISFYRLDSIEAFGLRQAQIVALLCIIASTVALAILYLNHQRATRRATS